MAHSSAVSAHKEGPPTLWPLGSGEWTSLRQGIEAYEQENRALRILVIDLSELILGL